MRHSFGAPVGDLGLILLINSLGSVAVSAFVGRLIHRLGVIALLAVASLCAAVGGVGFAVAPGLWLVLCIGPLTGAAAGMLDGGLNTAVALTGRPRLLNLLHGFYGIGTALGPLVVTAAILAGSWRAGYLVLVAVDLAAASSWIFYHRQLPPPRPASPEGAAAGEAGEEADRPADNPATIGPTAGWSRQRVASVLSAGLVVFFVYTGLEVGAGQWETSYLRGHLGLSASAAGLAAFGYWGALTVVRIGLALPMKSIPAQRLIGGGVLVSVAATGLIWWQPDAAIAVAGFVLLGAALAGMFPALIAVTPQRIGEQRAHHAIAWQVGAAAVGGSAISALIGLLINTSGLVVLGPALVVLALLLLVANAALARLAPIPVEAVGGGGVRP
jgi:fucose permease